MQILTLELNILVNMTGYRSMNSKKILIYLFIPIFSASSHAEFAVINDPDGFVNVRNGASASLPTLYTLNTSEVFFCFDKIINGYYSIFTSKTKSEQEDYEKNYIHKSRVKLISTYSKLSIVSKIADQKITFSGYGNLINITMKSFNPKSHVIIHDKDGELITKLDNYSKFWGTDQALPLQEYGDFKIKYNNVTSAIPREALGDLFNPHTLRMNAYYDSASQNIYITSSNGDGAGCYDVVFVINNGKFVKRFVVLSEYV